MRWATFVPGAGLLGAFIAELILHPVLYPAYAGIPLFVQALRSSQMSTAAQAHVHFEQRGRGFDEASYIESFSCSICWAVIIRRTPSAARRRRAEADAGPFCGKAYQTRFDSVYDRVDCQRDV